MVISKCREKQNKNKKALGRRAFEIKSSKACFPPLLFFSNTVLSSHVRPPRVERAGLRAQRQRRQSWSSSNLIDTTRRAARSEEATPAAASAEAAKAALSEMLRQRRRRHPFDDKGQEGGGKRRRSENGDDDEEEEEGIVDDDNAFSLVFAFCVFCCWHGRRQRLCRGCRRRLRRGSSDFFGVGGGVGDISCSIAVDALAAVSLGPRAPGLQAQARQGRAVPVPHGREELHARDGAR